MKSFRKYAKKGALVLVAAVVVAQFIRIEKTNPPVGSDVVADPAVKALLKKACYDCHSNETVWPWYSSVAPVSWLIGSDVNEGRQNLNFSEWGSYPDQIRRHKLEDIGEEVQSEGMPPWYYAIMHSAARLDAEERARIKNWTQAEQARSLSPLP